MLKKLIACCLVLMVSFVFLAPAFGQEMKKDEMKKDEPKKEEMKKAAKPMVLKSVSCDPACGFMVRSHDEKELISVVKMHAKTAHKKNLNDKQVMEMMKPG